MAGGYEVDMDALGDAAAGIQRTLDDVSAHPVDDLDPAAGAVGHAHLADTVSDFAHRWKKGVENLTEDGREIATQLSAAREAYRLTDANAAHTLGGVLRVPNGPDPAAR